MDNERENIEALIRDKYHGDRTVDLASDLARLRAGEPLAYVIGWIPFLGLTLQLESRPLIPRPETEWWAEELITSLNARSAPVRVLDLCAGSGAIGLAVLARVPHAHVSFGELSPKHTKQIETNLAENQLDASRADIRAGDLYEPFHGERFEVIAANPPYIPESRTLEESVIGFEPPEALFAGEDGLSLIRRIAEGAREHLTPGGELWLECDITNIEDAKKLLDEAGATRSEIRSDQYGRPRLVVSYYDS